jgi:hypothetical protein
MRVTVHPNDGGTPFAYKLGNVVEGYHNLNILTGEITPINDLLQGLVKQAEEAFPDAEVVVERLKDNGDDTSAWVSAEDTESEEPLQPESEEESAPVAEPEHVYHDEAAPEAPAVEDRPFETVAQPLEESN